MLARPVSCLMISRCPTVIEQVKGVALGIPRLQVEVCSAQRAPARVQQNDVGLILAHLGPSEEGITRLLWSVAQAGRPCPTVVLCDEFEKHQAAALRRAGAADYVALPAELERLSFLLGVLTHRLRASSVKAAPTQTDEGTDPDGLGVLMRQVRRVAPQDTTLLLTGETGTGKTRLARLIHEMSPRRDEPFLVVDCGSLSATLIESELFGHAKGAFTGADRERPGKLAAAGAGTLLLDEVNSLPLPLQGKLLRAVDERVYAPVGSEKTLPVRARLIAATNVPLEREVNAGRFRSDLFYRLDVVGFHLPPLRERRSSIVSLAEGFLTEFAARNRPDVVGFSPAALAALETHSWPGNVRELRNVVERAVALCPGDVVGISDLPEAIRLTAQTRKGHRSVDDSADVIAAANSLYRDTGDMEVRRILQALQKHNNNRLRVANELGISRVALYKKLHKYGLMQTEHTRMSSAHEHRA